MNRLYIKSLSVIALVGTLLMGACSDILEEQPRSIYTPDYFKTENGVMGGLTALYAHTRYFFGSGYYYAGMQSGTDEQTWGQNVNNDSKRADFSGQGEISAENNPYGGIWGVFSNINTANGIIENAEAVALYLKLI